MHTPNHIKTQISISGSTALTQILMIIFGFLCTLVVYTFIHETGHAIAALIFGARITSFNANFLSLSPHVGVDASFTTTQQAVFSLAGPLLPVLLLIVLLIVLPRQGNALTESFKMMAAFSTLGSMLPWIALPWLFLAGQRPSDDVVSFLLSSGIYPPVVSAVASLSLAVSLAIFLGKVDGVKGILARMTIGANEFLAPEARRTLAVLVVLFVLVSGLSFGIGAAVNTSTTGISTAPADYTLVATLEFDQRSYVSEGIYQWSLDQSSSVSLFFALDNLTHGPVKIALTGPDGYSNVLFTAGEKITGNVVVHPRDLSLDPGQYQVELTCPQGTSILSIYEKIAPGAAPIP